MEEGKFTKPKLRCYHLKKLKRMSGQQKQLPFLLPSYPCSKLCPASPSTQLLIVLRPSVQMALP